MNSFTRHFLTAAVFVAAIPFAPSLSHAQSAQDCLAAQLRSSGGAFAGLTTCYSKAMKKHLPVNPSCIRVKMAMLALNFSEAESLGRCLIAGEAAPIGRFTAEMVGTIATNLDLGGGKCSSRKVVAVGKAGRGMLACWAVAEATSSPVDEACLAAREARLLADFAKAEKKGGCLTVGDCNSRSCEVAAVAANLRTFLRGTATTSTTTTTTTTTATSSTSTMP